MKKIFFLMLAFLIVSAASMNAQVLIGTGDNPHPSAILELQSNNLGLLFPRVTLQSTEDEATITDPVAGLTVYNTATAGNGATAVVPGIYVFNGTAWTLQAPPVIKTQPAAFTFRRLYDVYGDPNASESVPAVTLSVEAGGATSYQWYLKPKNMNASAIAIDGATSADYNPTSTLTDWGLYSYYCVVSNAYGSVKSDVADVAIGCGAKTADGGWLKFMCHNLGASPVSANQSLDEITFASDGTGYGGPDTISTDAKGWLFQWGRIADGHQWRGTTNVTVAGPYISETNIEVPSGHPMYGKFITNNAIATAYDWRSPQIDYAWRNWDDGRFPCPAGWKVPSSSDWSNLYSSGSTFGTLSEATSNTWFLENKGLSIRPDGVTTTLFLPACGFRSRLDGSLASVGASAYYWSCDASASLGMYFIFQTDIVGATMAGHRGYGLSVRCVAIF
jgi:uncharacterized protein (TIGR02145 family)